MMLCLRMAMVIIILSTKLYIIQFYSKVLACTKSDLRDNPQVFIFLREIFLKYRPEKLMAQGGSSRPVVKRVSQKIFVCFT